MYQGRNKERERKPINVVQYVKSKTARANTGLIGGRIYLDGRYWDEVDYNELFPPPKLIYKAVQLDGRQLEQ